MDPLEPTVVPADVVEETVEETIRESQPKAPISIEELLTSFLTGVKYTKQVVISRFMELFDEAVESVLLDEKTMYSYMTNECGTIKINITKKIEQLYAEFFSGSAYGDNIVFKNAIAQWNLKHPTLKLTFRNNRYHYELTLSGFDTLAEYRAWAKLKLNAVTSYRLGDRANDAFFDASILTSGVLAFLLVLVQGSKF